MLRLNKLPGRLGVLLLLLPLLLSAAVPARRAPVRSVPARRPNPADPASLDGLWRGSLRMPGGELEVLFRLVRLTSGEYFATFDVPKQRISRLVVTVVTRADTVLLHSADADCLFTGRLSADGSQLTGLWQQPGLKTPLLLSRSAAAPAAATAAAGRPRLTPPYREEEVEIASPAAGRPLPGTLTVPPGAGPFPALVLLGDADSQDRDGTVDGFGPLGPLADYLTRRGIIALRLDARGAGTPGAAAAASTLTGQLADVQAALNYLRTRPEVRLDQLGLLGHGEGGTLALLAATQPLPPAFVVGLAPRGLPGADVALQQQAATLRRLQLSPAQVEAVSRRQRAMFDIIRLTPDNAQAQAIVANMLRQNNTSLDPAAAQATAAGMVSLRFRTFLDFDPATILPAVACPVLLLYGTDDLTLDVDANANALLRGLKGGKAATLRKLPAVNHQFQSDPTRWPVVNGQPRPQLAPAAAEAVRAWLVAQTSGGVGKGK